MESLKQLLVFQALLCPVVLHAQCTDGSCQEEVSFLQKDQTVKLGKDRAQAKGVLPDKTMPGPHSQMPGGMPGNFGGYPGPMPGGMPGGMPMPGRMPPMMPQGMPGGMGMPGMPGGMPGAMPGMQGMPGGMPGAMPGMQGMPGVMPREMPGGMPPSMLNSMPGGMPGAMPGSMPGSHGALPGSMPGPMAGGMPGGMAPGMMGGMPGGMPGAMPGPMPGGMFGGMMGGMPGGMPGAMRMPGGMPGPMPGGMPGMGRGPASLLAVDPKGESPRRGVDTKEALFKQYDANKDGTIDQDEWKKALDKALPPRGSKLPSLKNGGDSTSELLSETAKIRATMAAQLDKPSTKHMAVGSNFLHPHRMASQGKLGATGVIPSAGGFVMDVIDSTPAQMPFPGPIIAPPPLSEGNVIKKGKDDHVGQARLDQEWAKDEVISSQMLYAMADMALATGSRDACWATVEFRDAISSKYKLVKAGAPPLVIHEAQDRVNLVQKDFDWSNMEAIVALYQLGNSILAGGVAQRDLDFANHELRAAKRARQIKRQMTHDNSAIDDGPAEIEHFNHGNQG